MGVSSPTLVDPALGVKDPSMGTKVPNPCLNGPRLGRMGFKPGLSGSRLGHQGPKHEHQGPKPQPRWTWSHAQEDLGTGTRVPSLVSMNPSPNSIDQGMNTRDLSLASMDTGAGAEVPGVGLDGSRLKCGHRRYECRGRA